MELSPAEQNKKIVLKLFAGIREDAPGAFADLLTEDANWWVAGSLPISGDHGTPEMIDVVKFIQSHFDGTLTVSVNDMTAEGDRVAVEMSARGITRAGRTYTNDFHFLFSFENGKVRHVKEYCDTDEVNRVFFGTELLPKGVTALRARPEATS